MVELQCLSCGKPVFTTNYRAAKGCGKYCSLACRKKAEHKIINCEICGEELLVPRRSKARFCSRPCFQEHHRRMVGYEFRNCDVCGKEYRPIGANRIKYCSGECRKIGIQRHIDRPCAYCGKVFHPEWDGHKFCSSKCYGKSIRKPSVVKRCAYCQRLFRTDDKRRKYCGSKCYKLDHVGHAHHRWEGGKPNTAYPRTKNNTHPRSQHGFVYTHILVMEEYLGRYLDFYGKGHPDNEIVHHADRNRDNFSIDNLELCIARVHSRYHATHVVMQGA